MVKGIKKGVTDVSMCSRWLKPPFKCFPACSLMFSLAGGEAVQDPDVRPYNILLIMVDDLNDWTGFLGGHPQAITPHMDELAEKGMVFEQAHCPAPVCNPSRAAMMTGLRASTLGIYGNQSCFRNSPAGRTVKTLPEYLRQHGYHTLSRGKIYHRPQGPRAYPETWDEWYPYEGSRMGFSLAPIDYEKMILAGGLPFSHDGQRSFDWSPIDIEDEETSDFLAGRWAGEVLRQEHDKPFFLAVGIFRPHLPFYVPRKYFDLYPDAKELWIPDIDESELEDLPAEGRRLAGGDNPESDYQRLKAAGLLHDIVKGYLAAVSYADACVGEILNGLKEGPNLGNTIVILAGDHGWQFGEKLRYRKGTLWERSTRTTFFMRVPGMTEPGSRTHRTVNLLDIYPTLLDVCGLPPYDRNEGRSFRPVLENPDVDWPYPSITTREPHSHSVRTERWRLIQYPDGGQELYDHEHDPLEKINLAGNIEYREIIEELRAHVPEVSAPPVPDGDERIDLTSYQWAGPDGGEWNVPGYWMSGEVPSRSDDVIINSSRNQIRVSSYTAEANSIELMDGELYIFQSPESQLDIAGDFLQSGGMLHFRTTGSATIDGTYRATGGTLKILQGGTVALTVNGDLDVVDFEFDFVWNNHVIRHIRTGGTVRLDNAVLSMTRYSEASLPERVLLIHNTSSDPVEGSFSNAPFDTTVYSVNGTDYVLTLSDWDGDGIENDIVLEAR